MADESDSERIIRETGAKDSWDTRDGQQQVNDMMHGPGGYVAAGIVIVGLIYFLFFYAGWVFGVVALVVLIGAAVAYGALGGGGPNND